jgi:hypothetical protein
MAVSCVYRDEPAGSGATVLVSYNYYLQSIEMKSLCNRWCWYDMCLLGLHELVGIYLWASAHGNSVWPCMLCMFCVVSLEVSRQVVLT